MPARGSPAARLPRDPLALVRGLGSHGGLEGDLRCVARSRSVTLDRRRVGSAQSHWNHRSSLESKRGPRLRPGGRLSRSRAMGVFMKSTLRSVGVSLFVSAATFAVACGGNSSGSGFGGRQQRLRWRRRQQQRHRQRQRQQQWRKPDRRRRHRHLRGRRQRRRRHRRRRVCHRDGQGDQEPRLPGVHPRWLGEHAAEQQVDRGDPGAQCRLHRPCRRPRTPARASGSSCSRTERPDRRQRAVPGQRRRPHQLRRLRAGVRCSPTG